MSRAGVASAVRIALPIAIASFLAIACGCATSPKAGGNQAGTNANTSSSQPIIRTPDKLTTGSIEVTSTPSGVSILLIASDEGGAGEPQPRGVTPTTVTGLAPGKYTVDLEKSGYKFFQKAVVVKEGATVKVNAVLSKQASK